MPAFSPTELKRVTRILKALGHENRLTLYLAICDAAELTVDGGDCRIADVAADLRIGAPTVSHHLKELERADLITTERDGRHVTARVVPATAELIKALL